MKLSREAFDRASIFIKERGRPLEAARFAYHFEGGSAEAVLDQLSSFQNQDGGYGHGLEPDLRTEHSSALATSVAFQIIREIAADTRNELVKAAVTYLENSFDEQNLTWRIIPRSAGDSPHAPWWDQNEGADRFEAFSLNPTAELLGYLFDYGQDSFNSRLLQKLSNKVFNQIKKLEEIEMHDFLCCQRLSLTPGLPAEYRRRLLDNLLPLLPGIVAMDPSTWSAYALLPLQVADSPDSPFHEPLKAVIEENLLFDAEGQDENGSWKASWSWGDSYPDVWPIAEQEWAGIITLTKLLTFKNYRVIEGLW